MENKKESEVFDNRKFSSLLTTSKIEEDGTIIFSLEDLIRILDFNSQLYNKGEDTD